MSPPKILRAFFRKEKLDADMAEEMRAHLELLAAEYQKRGLSADAAQQAAQREFGGAEQIKERCRDQRGMRWLDQLAQDFRYAARALRKAPGFSMIVILTLALGIGANTSLFTVLYALVWQPLPVKDPTTVVNIHQSFAGTSSRQARGGINRLSYPEYLNYRDRTQSLAGLLAFEEANFTLRETKTSKVAGVFATGNYFSVLGATTELGRAWSAADCEIPGACPLAVLSYDFWQRQFGGDRDVVGRTISLNRQALTIIGVAARDFRGTGLLVPDVWVPLPMRSQLITDEPDRLVARDYSWLRVMGRRKADVSLDQVRQEFSLLAQQSDTDAAITNYAARRTQVQVKPGAYFNSPEELRDGLPIAATVMTAIGLILVVVCANVSNLLLARASVRRREIGVRLALGASRPRLVRQLLTESFLLAGIAGAVGLALAFALPRVVIASLPAQVASLPGEALPGLNLAPNLPILGYCTLVSLVAAIGMGLVPALQATRLDLSSMLAAQNALVGRRIGGARLRSVLVITQVAVSLLLLISAGLLVRGLRRALSTDLGFDRKNVFVLSIDLEASGYDTAQAHAYNASLIERLGGVAGVKAVARAHLAPLRGSWSTTIRLERDGATGTTRNFVANLNCVSPAYFETLGIAMVRGRHFTEADVQSGAQPAVISQAMASRFWPGEDPIGRRFFVGNAESYEIVGIARDVSSLVPGVTDGPYFYRPALSAGAGGLELIVRTEADGAISAKRLRELAAALDPGVTISIHTLDENVDRMLRPAQLASILAAGLGLLALGLVAIGVYGVVAYVVSQRTREIGVRIALGAESGQIQRQVIGEGLRVVAVGIAVGLLLAAAGSRVLQRVIFGLSALDPVTFVGVGALLATIATFACWFPARRAAQVDPMVALRCE